MRAIVFLARFCESIDRRLPGKISQAPRAIEMTARRFVIAKRHRG